MAGLAGAVPREYFPALASLAGAVSKEYFPALAGLAGAVSRESFPALAGLAGQVHENIFPTDQNCTSPLSYIHRQCSTTGKPTRSFATERVSLDSV